MMDKPRINVHWFRRDLRLEDNHALFRALADHGNVLSLFIFDTDILGRLEQRNDRRVDFIHRALQRIKRRLEERGSTLLVKHGKPLDVWRQLLQQYAVDAVTAVHDHEPYALERDKAVREMLEQHGVIFRTFKDISVFERDEVLKADGTPYTVFTPYGRKWRSLLDEQALQHFPSEAQLDRLAVHDPSSFPPLAEIGFEATDLREPPPEVPDRLIAEYGKTRNLPGMAGTSRLGVHLRFGTVSVRALARQAMGQGEVFLNELAWREFFMQLLWHYPHVVDRSFKPAYDHIPWRDDPTGFEAWCQGRTGFPFVDAGMRELAATGFMHNRARMVTASFLVKDLLIDPKLGETWFARHLLDFELSSNNGNWQWASGSGCDAAPWFRVFNPTLQLERFDPELRYVHRWVPEYGTFDYPVPIVDHAAAVKRTISRYKTTLDEWKA
jgi:deoxyribodipyrimidine photo-lyase